MTKIILLIFGLFLQPAFNLLALVSNLANYFKRLKLQAKYIYFFDSQISSSHNILMILMSVTLLLNVRLAGQLITCYPGCCCGSLCFRFYMTEASLIRIILQTGSTGCSGYFNELNNSCRSCKRREDRFNCTLHPSIQCSTCMQPAGGRVPIRARAFQLGHLHSSQNPGRHLVCLPV